MMRMRSSSAHCKEQSPCGVATHLIPALGTNHTCNQAVMQSVRQTGSAGAEVPTKTGCGLSCDWKPGRRGACTTFASFSQNSKLWVSTPKAFAMLHQGSDPPSWSIRVTGFLQPHHRGCLHQYWSRSLGHTALYKYAPSFCRFCVRRMLCNALWNLLTCQARFAGKGLGGLSMWVGA